ncbi:multidrug ABC transporter ATP-binding protein [Cellulomonas sp. WB94]|uniref:ABC transporter ATP-binding protein n=1 Tax=Cellulomonas sp. WB94 TaxID=2173174 RepID=UPI000D586ECC|nr:ABC transporter ATP-binding protein [Cellulomonas sp. WB94]PVU82658.1 multidrug ABC transporter ATP-binding protein [Cellulomonas sp. WB94]
MEPSAVLSIRGLSKKYPGRRGVQANDGIDLDVLAGQVVGLLGHNGAGKTTLVNQVVGLVRPDAGSIRLAGIDAVADPDGARRLASIQAQANVPITGLTPRTAIQLVGRIRGGSRRAVAERTQRLIDILDIGSWADMPSQKISGGIARLTAFCMTAVVPGRIVVLDEPTNDVDPVRRRLLWDAIRTLADDGAGVLLVTHNVREAERVVDHLVILDQGKVLAADTPAGLAASTRGVLTVELDLAPGLAGGGVGWPPGVTETSRERLRAAGTVPADLAADVVRWAQAEVDAGAVERYALTAASLEDVYVRLVGSDRGATSAEPELAVVA